MNNIVRNPIIDHFRTPNPDRRHRRRSRSWKGKLNRYGNRIHKRRQYYPVDMAATA